MQKAQLLAILAGTTCPICNSPKVAYQWTCTPCYRPYQQSPEHHTLSEVCDQHMIAADAFLQLVKQGIQKPETD